MKKYEGLSPVMIPLCPLKAPFYYRDLLYPQQYYIACGFSARLVRRPKTTYCTVTDTPAAPTH
ncbi:hypothetical protein V1477_018074 [Vespula maculifrons]|uniref:Uncharacterized protein n=1 Tax=Vespula maculifrons TaxID=7453 RepID=A0ABD2B1E2_VESMC